MSDLWVELRRRKVTRVAIAYAVIAWVLLQVGDTVISMLELPGWSGKAFFVVLAVGLPVALFLSWAFDITPQGIVATESDEEPAPRVFEFAEPEPVDLNELELSVMKRPQLVGRMEECELLKDRIEHAVAREGGIVLVGGEPGVGKTRLGEEALTLGRSRGMLPLTGHAYDDSGAPFVTSTEILEEVTRIMPSDVLRNALGTTAPEIARLLPDLRRRFPEIAQPLVLPPEQQQRYLFNAVLEFVGRLSRCSPLVILLDDLHWADESSVLLLEHIAPHVSKLPVLLVITYRDVAADIGEPFQRALSSLTRHPNVTRIPLRRLGIDDVHDLLTSLGGQGTPDAVVELFYKETRGNAFFVRAVFQHLAEEGRLVDAYGHWLPDIRIDALAVPDGVRLVIQQRLKRLRGATSDMLRRAAVMGLRFDFAVIEEASDDSPDQVLESIEEAEAAALILPSAGGRTVRYEFSHALVRQSLLEDVSAPRRQRHHLSIARAMEKLYSESGRTVADIARHYDRAGPAADVEKTRHFLQLAGQQSLEAVAPEEAIVFFDRALELDDSIEPKQRAKLLYQRGLASKSLARWDEATKYWHEALPILESESQVEIVATVCWELAYQGIWANDMQASISLAQRGLDAVGSEPSTGHCRLLAIQGHALGASDSYAKAEESLTKAIAMAEMLGDDRLLGAEVLMARLYQSQHWLKGAQHAETADRAIPLVRRTGSPWDISSTLGGSLLGYFANGRFNDAEALYDEAYSLAVKLGDIGNEFHVLLSHGCIQCFRGNFVPGRQWLQSAVDRCREAQFPWLSILQTWLGMADFWRGDWRQAATLLDEAVENQVAGFMGGTERAHKLLTLAYAREERAKDLLAELRPLLPQAGAENQHGRWHVGMASLEAAALMGMKQQCFELYASAVQLSEAGMTVVWTLGLSENLAGIAAAAGERWTLAERHFDTALKQADSINYPVGHAETLRWLAHMLLQRDQTGDAARAEELLAKARREYTKLGMTEHARLAGEMLDHRSGATP